MKITAMTANSQRLSLHGSVGALAVEVVAAAFRRAAFSSYRRTKSAGLKAAATKPLRSGYVESPRYRFWATAETMLGLQQLMAAVGHAWIRLLRMAKRINLGDWKETARTNVTSIVAAGAARAASAPTKNRRCRAAPMPGSGCCGWRNGSGR